MYIFNKKSKFKIYNEFSKEVLQEQEEKISKFQKELESFIIQSTDILSKSEFNILADGLEVLNSNLKYLKVYYLK